MCRNRVVEIDEALDDKIRLRATIVAVLRGAVHKRMMRANIARARVPVSRILWCFSKENEQTEASLERKLLDTNAGHPFVEVAGGVA